MTRRCLWSLCLLLALLLPPGVLSQGFDLADALDEVNPTTPTPKPAAPGGGKGGGFNLEDSLDLTTKAPSKVTPKAPVTTPVKPKPKPAADDFDLSDALDSNNDIGIKDKNKGQGGGFSDNDLFDVSKDETYHPDKGKGGRPSGSKDQLDQYDENSDTTAEVGTIAGIASAVAMALVGAVSSYISYQKKKLCFGLQQSLNADMVKTENPEAVVATEPQVQQTLLEPPNAEPRTEENAV
uniref:CD99 antigen-like protein 2 isoform X1 n=1 Tax=Gasterosteus aculeatus aculeatus TaxID=481459 RepID=UPI001A992C80|nr:CD99 antigen-like protein 2 isoform X1 [Gasterosteus aculeatus aculeatus]